MATLPVGGVDAVVLPVAKDRNGKASQRIYKEHACQVLCLRVLAVTRPRAAVWPRNLGKGVAGRVAPLAGRQRATPRESAQALVVTEHCFGGV